MPQVSIARSLRRLRQVSPARRAMVIEAFLLLAWAKLALKIVRFSSLSRRFGVFVSPRDPRAAFASRPASGADLAAEIGWAVTRVARRAPFAAVCLPQAIAAHAMLARRGVPSVLHFGAASGTTKPLDAHAWLTAAGVEVTGYPVPALTEIGCFVPRTLE